MKLKLALILIALCTLVQAQTQRPSLSGIITDPSGSVVPAALVQIVGPGGQQRTTTDTSGKYTFPSLQPGTYLVRVIAKGFTVNVAKDVAVNGPVTLNTQLNIEAQAQVVNVEDEANSLDINPDSNAGALVLKEKELATLSDDPDELAQQLQAMAGPATGPNGGQIFIDGFSGGTLPPKASIREVRINSNPYSPEYDRPGFGRIEILTKPGSDYLRGSAFFQFNNEHFNSRSPLYTGSSLPAMQQRFFGVHLSGPIKKQKASFGFDLERRVIDDNAFILATTLDSSLQPVTVNEAVPTPQTRMTFTPRVDLTLNAKNTLILRYQNGRTSQENVGVGSYSLDSRGYQQSEQDHAIQATETAVLSAHAINETRFQFMHTSLSHLANISAPALLVQGAFESGGAQIGNSGSTQRRLELSNMTTITRGTHAFKWGARVRQSWLEDTSVNNFGGTYTFFGGGGPLLDANNQPIPGTFDQLTALERYRRTLLFQQLGYSTDLIRALGGGASQFSLAGGIPTTPVNQFDVGLFVNDDWRIRRNITLSYGMRYETQTNLSDINNWSPRIGVAWGIGKGNQIKTVVRAGFGVFYDRLSENSTLQADRYNGVTQQSYLLRNPDFFPVIPPADLLEVARQPQQLYFLDSSMRAARVYQASLGVERQINKYVKLSAQFVSTRGVHQVRSRNINAPIDGLYPYDDKEVRLLSESTGFSRIHQLIVSPNVNYKKLFLFGFYSYSDGKSDFEGMPADPYNLRAEWGPSSFAGIRHRMVIGTSLPMPWKISINPFMMASSGAPYNITTGIDSNLDGFTNDRPALLTGVGQGACTGARYVFTPAFGCFDLTPAPGTAIGRNFGVGPATVTLNMRVSRTWSFGGKSEPSSGQDNGPRGGPGGGMGGPGGGGMRGGMGGGMRGPMGGGPGGGPPPGMFGANSGRRYNLTFSASAMNLLNHANYAPPSGDLSSPYFGEYRSLAGFGPFGGASTYNRKIDLQLRFMF